MAVSFPFERNRRYPIGQLRDFERAVRQEREQSEALSNDLRAPSRSAPKWMQLRLKETLPLKIYSDHQGLSDDDEFLLKPDGDAVDAVLWTNGNEKLLQITLAAPIWGLTERNSGYQYHQAMTALNRSEMAVGWPPYRIENEIAIGEIQTLTNVDRDDACTAGLIASLTGKAGHDGGGVTLPVLAREFYFNLLDPELFSALVRNAVCTCQLIFDSVAVFDSHPGFFIEIETLGAEHGSTLA